jgi:hypothetical protein
MKVKDGDCIGGYTEAQWSSKGKKVEDTAAMLFNLSKQRHFPLTQQARSAIWCRSDNGVGFSGGDSLEFCAFYEPFNDYRNCVSWADREGYKIPL